MLETNFDSDQIEKAFPNYKYQKSLGRGAYGKVYLVRDINTGDKLAVKKISCFGMCQYERNNAINQVRILASLDHSNIIKFVSGMFDNNEDDLYMFMEYASEGDLAMLIEQTKEKKKRISENNIWNIVLHIAQGLQFLHKNNIIHRDIKPANIFKTENGVYKIADLNVSKIIANGNLAKTKTGSPLYVSPEVWNKEEGYNQKCDVWSLGIVTYELCCLKVPYEANSIDQLIRKQKTMRLKNIPVGYSAALNQLIHQMLQSNPRKRISAEKVKATCLKNLKLQQQEFFQPLVPLMDTIVIPQSEQRWINLVPLPPKIKKQPSNNQRKQSKQKSYGDVLSNRSNLFSALQNRSLLIPKQKNSQQKLSRVRLPSIQRKNSVNQSEIRIIEKIRERSKDQSREKSREKSRQKSRQKSSQGYRAQTPERRPPCSSRISRKG